MLRTTVGAVEDAGAVHYLRPETAQGIFVNYLNVMNSARKKPPFGIGQTGKSFRNEITPGNFIFRTREFEQMEMEFFVVPGTDEEWHEYWLQERWNWYVDLGLDPENMRFLEHPQEKLSHYSKRTVDIEYRFRFAGSEWAELEGIANRTDFDLRSHGEHSGTDLSYFDQETNERWIPYVIEPAAGLTRAVLAFLLDAYDEDEAPNAKGGVDKRTVLRLDPRLAPVKVAVLPLSRNEVLSPKAQGPGGRPAQAVERRLRRCRCDRPALPPPGRDRHAVLRHRRLRHPRRPGRHHPRARLDGPGAHRPRRRRRLAGGAAARLLIGSARRALPIRSGRLGEPSAEHGGLGVLVSEGLVEAPGCRILVAHHQLRLGSTMIAEPRLGGGHHEPSETLRPSGGRDRDVVDPPPMAVLAHHGRAYEVSPVDADEHGRGRAEHGTIEVRSRVVPRTGEPRLLPQLDDGVPVAGRSLADLHGRQCSAQGAWLGAAIG